MELTEEQIEIINDLKIQSMMFNMDIDWEALTLIEKREDTTPQWLKNWQKQRRNADNDPANPEQAWA